jgi:hypothetical protein
MQQQQQQQQLAVERAPHSKAGAPSQAPTKQIFRTKFA